MFTSFKQGKAQILLLSNFELRFFIWEDKKLRFISRFTDSPQGHATFEQLQASFAEYPAIIITNFIEESFRNDTVPPVSGKDLNLLLERKLDFAFRKTTYRKARVFERQGGGRRDNKILLSGINKPELLRPWIKILLENQTPVQTISSVAYIAEAFARNIGLNNEEHLLLISLENNSELRQSYLKNGRLVFSRLTTLGSQNTTQLGNDIYKETLQIRNYLERVKFLPYEAMLKVKIYSGFDDETLLLNHRSNQLNSIECINIKRELAAYPVELNGIEAEASLYLLSHLLKKKGIANVYAPFPVQKYFQLKRISNALGYLALGFIALSLAITTPTIISAMNTLEQQNQFQARTSPLRNEYDVLSQRFPETPIPSQEMALLVSTYEDINRQTLNPADAMSLIGDALAASPNLQATEINWLLLEVPPADPFQPRRYNAQANDDNAFVYAILENRTRLQFSIQGIATSPSSYREAHEQVLAFTRALESNPGITVNPRQMPTDIRVDTTVQTTVDGNALRAPFLLEVNMELMP